MTHEDIIDYINQDDNLDLIYNLKSRWADERDYEDWAEYEKVMAGTLPAKAFIRGTKRPFGMLVHYEDGQVHITLKEKKNSICLSAKITHK